jgi:hypothetical protein
MRRSFQVFALGALGAVLAAALIGGAFVLAGTSLTEPASAVRVVVGPPLRADRTDRHEPDRTPEADRGDHSPGPAAAGGSLSAPLPTDPGVVGSAAAVPGSPVPTSSDDGNAERGDD